MPTVEIYSTPSCHFCHLAKDYFNDHGIKYTEHDVATDSAKRGEMVDKSGQLGVPVIVVKKGESEDVIVGFDQNRLSSLLGI